MILRDYQIDAVNSVYDYFATGGVAPLIVTPTGSGKSVILAEIIYRFCQENPDRKVLVITHVKELVEQDAAKIQEIWYARNLSPAPMGIYSAGMKRREMAQITVASIQSIYRREEFLGAFDLIMVDECFVAGTKISTPKGLIDIDQLRCGDLVYTASGVGSIDSISIRPSEEIYLLEFDDGTTCECTGSHPFFTERGWTQAKLLEISEGIFSAKSVRFLWESIQSLDEKRFKRPNNICNEGISLESAEMLLSILCKEIKESNEYQCSQNENESHAKEDSASTYQKRRERALATFSAASATSCFGGGMASGICGSNKIEKHGVGISNVLQNGHSKSINDDRNRSGRSLPPIGRADSTRQKENGISHLKRLVNISRIKQESPRPVFNLHVNGHPSYFANGALVHNCHLIPRNSTGMYSSFLMDSAAMNDKMRLIGLTATPYRLQSGMLHEGDNAMFDGISYEADLVDLINRGFLSRLTCKHGDDVDLSGVRKTAGEFNLSDLGEAMSAMQLIEHHSDLILERCEGRRAVLVFAVTVDHAHAVSEALNARGMPSSVVSGDMPMAERDGVIGAFKAGRLRALVNCQVLTTGFDYPAIDAVVMLRPTLSPGLYVQMAGRGLRVAPGKQDCLVLDFGSNVVRHGFIDAVRPPGKKKPGKAPVKKCPQCSGLIPLGAKECPQCGYEFPPAEADRKSNKAVYDGPMLSVDAKAVRIAVKSVSYKKHISRSNAPVLRVTYMAGLRTVDEYICLEHQGFPRVKAERWWRTRAPGNVPFRVDDALSHTKDLRVPSYLLVNFAGKFPEIIKQEF